MVYFKKIDNNFGVGFNSLDQRDYFHEVLKRHKTNFLLNMFDEENELWFVVFQQSQLEDITTILSVLTYTSEVK